MQLATFFFWKLVVKRKKIVGPVWWLWRVCNNAAASLPEIICMQHHDVWLAIFKGRCTENCDDDDVQHHPMIVQRIIYVKDLSSFITYNCNLYRFMFKIASAAGLCSRACHATAAAAVIATPMWKYSLLSPKVAPMKVLICSHPNHNLYLKVNNCDK